MSNPVLLNDLRRNWFRRRPVHAVALMAVLILILTLFVPALAGSVFGWSPSDYPLWRFPDILLPAIAPVFAAGSFAREHEQRTWQDVLLTRLTAGQILAGKFWACFFPTLATIIVLFPPLAMVLILTNVQWAQEPGSWMAAITLRFVLASVFYLAISLVCSYHSRNARAALVVCYVALALYGVVSFLLWRGLIDELFRESLVGATANRYGEVNGLTSISTHEFGFSLIDIAYMLQSLVLTVVLFLYLLLCIRRRRAPQW